MITIKQRVKSVQAKIIPFCIVHTQLHPLGDTPPTDSSGRT
ncbi:hypothetical protein CRENPOLYSF2_940006 [Crenothrix polyspora]|uniref:Uncharacterized protein n=1 Tax=Crenothrix polyspora TaxID=360316 RepID=A0A1R4HK30_9GAMM|nr:hypothetical protein CRENPOLYSF2_940006 [Crenothrix polyspora]